MPEPRPAIPTGEPEWPAEPRIALNWILATLTFGLYVLRIWVQRHRRQTSALVASNVLSVIAWISAVYLYSTSTYVLRQFPPWLAHQPRNPKTHPYILEYTHKLDYSNTFIYYLCLWSIKGAFIAIYFDIFPKSHIEQFHLRAILYLTSAYAIASFVAVVLASALYCLPVETNWDSPNGNNCQAFRSHAILFATFATNVTTDMLVLALPISFFRTLKLRRAHLVGILFVFGIACITIIASIVRTVFCYQAFNSTGVKSFDESIHEVDRIYTWTGVEIWSATLVFGLPPLRVFIRQTQTIGSSRETSDKSFISGFMSSISSRWSSRGKSTTGTSSLPTQVDNDHELYHVVSGKSAGKE